MLLLRSFIFNIVFYLVFITAMIIALPILFMNEEVVFLFWKYFSLELNWITKIFAGIDFRVEGREHIKNHGVIYAIRHESLWETLALISGFDHPIFVMKKELFNIPIFGAMARKSGAISVDREDGVRALTSILKKIKQYIKEDRVVVIFPEGTRMPTGVFHDLKRGIALFYKSANCPVIPVIHNSGKFWPKHGFIKHPGVVQVKILPPINPGLSQDDFMNNLNDIFKKEIEKMSKE